MFSCALFHVGSDTSPVPAESSEVAVQVIGLVGQGKATCSYRLDEDRRGLLLYVPSMLILHSTTRQRVRLSRCQLSITRGPGGETVTRSLHLTKLETGLADSTAPARNSSDLPDYLELRRRYKVAVTKLCGAHSCEDVLLHVGDLPRGSELTLCFEFLTQFSSSSHCPRVHYAIERSLPSLHLSYNLLLAALSPVEQVTCPTRAVTPHSFSWSYLHSEEQYRNLVHVAYQTTHQGLDWDLTRSAGFTVHLSSGGAARCHSSLFPSSDSVPHTSPLTPYDGVMMISDVFGEHQLPLSAKQQQFCPSEFVFVVDCSGSMSGTNIQIAADTLITCIKSLPMGSYFNVIAFGSTFRQLFHNSREYTQQNMTSAVQFANQLQASLGGTELLRPLQWIFNKTKRCNGLPCQVFIITDGGVPNTMQVLRCVRKNGHQARCHTFGIGPEVCVELVNGIAAASGGQCVLLAEGERLQTKVMEVLKDSMQPSVTNTVLQWHPPEGYTVVDSSPRSLGTMFSGNSYAAFALLRRTEHPMNGTCDDNTTAPTGSATITGTVNGGQVEIRTEPVTLPLMTPSQSREMSSLLFRSAMWSKMCDMELQALSSSRKNSHNDTEDHADEPPAKRSRLNGMNGSHYMFPSPASGQKSLTNLHVREELAELSIGSGILCPLTYFRADGGHVTQIVPMPHGSLSKPSTRTSYHSLQNGSSSHYHRKRKRTHHISSAQPNPTLSLSSFARNTISCIGSTLKAVANITTFGLIGQESPLLIEQGQRIEDEEEYQEHRHLRLHWDEAKGNIVYPDIYYRSHPSNHYRLTSTEQGKRKSRHLQQKQTCGPAPQLDAMSDSASRSVLTTPAATHLPSSEHHPKTTTTTELAEGANYSGEEEEEEEGLTISDTESDSSVDPDWEDLRKPNELLPLIHMQLFSGAWPMVRAFSYAVGVPLEEIRKLPLQNCTSREEEGSRDHGNASGAERKAHFWATALAVACLEQHFTEFSIEWEVVAYKGRCWLESELHQTGLCMSEVQRMARELVLRQS